jgi:hypothetical protein
MSAFGLLIGAPILIFGILGIWLALSLIRAVFGPVQVSYDPKQIRAFERAIRGQPEPAGSSGGFNDLRGAGGSNEDEAEWRYRASGGYGGEFIDDPGAGISVDLDYRALGAGKTRD